MSVVYDVNGNIKQNRLYLANPQKKYIGVLSGARNLRFTENFNNMHELSFDIYEKLNIIDTEYYDSIEVKRLIHAENIGWFQIIRINKKKDDSTLETYKSVQCLSIENELIGKRIDNINGVFALYDISDTAHSILHIIAQYSGWTIAHVDNDLLSLYRVFSSDTEQIYNFLTTTVSKSFECVFVFNNYDRSISAYKLDNIGDLTNIVISKRNVLNEYEEESLSDYIVTKMRVKGADGVDIRSVNFGKDYITNTSYYKVPNSTRNGWMTQGLVDAITNYDNVFETYQASYTTLLSTYKTKQAELNTLNTELKELQSQQSAQDVIWQPLAQQYNGTPPVGTPAYTTYINAKNASDGYYSPIATKKAQITSKQTEIDSVQDQLDAIGDALDESNFFTSDQIKEYGTFLTESEEYQDSTFVVTDTMTQPEVIDLKLQLLENAKKELAIKSQPQYTITIKASNLFTIQDNDSPIPYSKWVENFVVGNLITLKFRDDYWVTSRLISMTIDFNNLQDLELKFSNKSRLDNELVRFAETLADAGRTSSSLDYNYFGFKDASSQTNQVRQFINSTLNATLNAVQNNDNQEMLLDTYGLHMRKWLSDQNKYDLYQAWWTNNTLLFTDDGWTTIKGGIGVFTDTSGNKSMSVFADVIAGTLIMGEKLYISNTSGTYTINNNGFTATATVGANTYSAGINPSTPAEIINVKVNGVNKLYVDTIGNKVVFSGSLIAGDINIGSNRFIVDNTGLVTINSNGLVVNSTNFSLTSNGILSCNNITATNGNFTNGNFSGAITTSTIIGTTFTNVNGSNTQVAKIQNGIFTGTSFNAYDYNSVIGGITGVTFGILQPGYFSVGMGTGVSLTTIIDKGEITTNSINCYFINGGTPITTDNRTNYTYPPSFHYQDSNTITPILTGGGNVGLNGINVASVNYVQDNFQPKSSSDLRLKKNILTLDIPDDLFMDLKPKQYEFKCSPYPETKVCGFIAQELESVFESYGLNPLEYNIIDKMQIRNYTDEGQYIDDYIHRINYENFHAIEISMIQKLYRRIEELELKLKFN